MKELELTGPQSEVFLMDCYAPLFIGGYGSGKTESLIVNSLRDALWHRNVKVGSYCPTYDLLKLNLIPRLEAYLIEAGVNFSLNKSDHIFTLENDSQIIMRSMDNPSRIVAYEVFRSHVDEIDTLDKKRATDVWNKIVARNRQKVFVDGEKVDNRVSAYTTPDHGFASFTYERWKKNPGDGHHFVRAPTQSNPFLDPDYAERLLATYPSEMVEAYVLGEWCNFNQGTVYRGYDREKNRTDAVHRPKEPIRVGMDFNVGKMAAIIYVVRGKTWHAIDEYVKGIDTPDVIEWLQENYENCRVTVYPDATGKNRTSKSASESDISLLRDARFTVRAKRANPRVRERVLAANKAFRELTVLVNDEKCPNFAESLEQQAYNLLGEPDKTTDHDHPNDAGTYPIVYHFPIRRPTHSGSIRGTH